MASPSSLPSASSPASAPPISWKRNLFFVWLSQFFSLAGFGFGLPFAAYYIQELGITDKAAIKYWTAMFQASAPLTLAIMSPLWGMLADRYGRRLMMLRANFGAAVILSLMGSVPNVEWLIILRLLQGMFTGTVTAAQTLVAVSTPERSQGMALGTLNAAVFSGTMAGAFFGGLCADLYSYSMAFRIGGGLMVIAGLLIIFGVREQFSPPEPETKPEDTSERRWRLPSLGPGLPLLVLIAGMALARRLDMPILPLFIQALHGSRVGASSWTGLISAVGCVALVLSGLIMGRLVDRFSAPTIAKLSALGAAVFMLLQGAATGFLFLFSVRFAMLFCVGGLDPVFQVWLSRVTTKERRGAVFGWAVTAKSSAWIVGPLLSAGIAATLGRWFDRHGGLEVGQVLLRPARAVPADVVTWLPAHACQVWHVDLRALFVVGAVAFALLVPLIGWATRRMLADEQGA